jgi:Nucleotidyl transferase of unknown function (DUF2204)
VNDAIQPLTLVPALKAVMQWLTSERVDGAIIGGVAASIRGRPRITKDVDVVVLADDIGWERVLDSAARYGLVPRIDNALDFASRSRMLLLRHDKSGIEVDVSLGGLPFEREAVERASMVDVKRLRLRISSAEDLVIMKAVARRPQDWLDVDVILSMNPDLDLARIRHHLREFSSVLEMPEIYDDFERLLRRKRKGQT